MYKKMIVTFFLCCNVLSAEYKVSLSAEYTLGKNRQAEFGEWLKTGNLGSFTLLDENDSVVTKKISEFSLYDIDALSRELERGLSVGDALEDQKSEWDVSLRTSYFVAAGEGVLLLMLLKKLHDNYTHISRKRVIFSLASLSAGCVFLYTGLSFMHKKRRELEWKIEIHKALTVQKNILLAQE